MFGWIVAEEQHLFQFQGQIGRIPRRSMRQTMRIGAIAGAAPAPEAQPGTAVAGLARLSKDARS